MPELPEVETVVRALDPVLTGRRITHVEARRPDLRWPLPADLAPRLTGARVTSVARRGKYGLVATDRGDTMVFHLGMSGRMRLDPADASPHDHLLLRTEEDRTILLTDPRRFGHVDLTPTAQLPHHPLLRPLGVEPLSPAFTAARLARLFDGRSAPVKNLLVDQRLVAGMGNIYASEALHRARIHPARPAGELARPDLARLVRATRAVLAEAIAAGGSSLRDHLQPDGTLGLFQHRWRVYARSGEPCRSCSAPISRVVQAGRSTFLCERCQPA